MDTFVIQGGQKLSGEIAVMGSKNAATAIIAATVLVTGDTVLHNVPRIADVETMLEIMRGIGAKLTWTDEHTLILNSDDVDPAALDAGLVKKIRSSILLLGCLAHRFGRITMATPGGCQIGTRPLDAHFDTLKRLGFESTTEDDFFVLERKNEPSSEIVMSEFSVTATENVIMASVLLPGERVVKCADADYQVQDLCWFLEKAGASIQGIGTHTLTIAGAEALTGTEYTIMPDPIELGTFIILAAVTKSELTIPDAAAEFLTFPMLKFEQVGISFTYENRRRDPGGHYELMTVKPKIPNTLKAMKKLETMVYPGFKADLMQPFALLMTQAQGVSLLHDWMYDGRNRYVSELQKMGANINILDPHRILIVGPTPLYAKEITSYDLRAGATMILAGLAAEGTTTIHNIHQADRGYERIDERLRSLGADIRRV